MQKETLLIKEFLKVTESLEFMSAKFDDLEKEIKKKDGKINQLEKTIENLVEKQTTLSSFAFHRRFGVVLTAKLSGFTWCQ